jgi:phosphoribosyl-dephospho-CoA transferase
VEERKLKDMLTSYEVSLPIAKLWDSSVIYISQIRPKVD